MTELFEAMLSEAERGKTIIKSCIDRYGKESTSKVVLLFPDDDKDMLTVAYKYFDMFIRDYDTVIVIASINTDGIRSSTNRSIAIVHVSEEDMRCTLRYATMVERPQIVSVTLIKIMSLTKPYNQKMNILTGFKDLSLEKLVCRCLYGMHGSIHGEAG